MSYIISEDGKELLKDVRDFCVNEVKEQVKEYDISGEWPKEIHDQAIEMQLHMMDVPEEYGGLGLDHMDQAAIVEQIAWADAGVAVTLNGNGLALKPVLLAGNEEQKKKAAQLACEAGIDWVKQSSGWGVGGCAATVEDVKILKENISLPCRVKVSGKVNSLEKMKMMFEAGAELVGTSSGPEIIEGLIGDPNAY